MFLTSSVYKLDSTDKVKTVMCFLGTGQASNAILTGKIQFHLAEYQKFQLSKKFVIHYLAL